MRLSISSGRENAQQNHCSECGRATSVANSNAPGRPHRSVPALEMSQVHQLIDTFRSRTDLTVTDQRHAWLIRIPKAAGEVCSVTVPRERFEWFADVRRNGKEVWRDFMDHYGSPAPELDAEMAACIGAFVERVTSEQIKLPLKIYEE
jgi:hypothetical protein